ncbi:MAG: valine--tRNA ligase [Firmicutes bacterium]|nr:valine--tRNA ligase [Bacillota bacterium]
MERTRDIPKTYNPKEVEDRYYHFWEERGYFQAEIDRAKKPFTIVIPPPNVTGQLHMGHALDNTIQDILIRWRRMQGIPTLWLPGTDHAGLATQIKVEEGLRKEGKSRHELGRDRFVERVWEWKRQYGDRITNQLRKLGASCDWSRERFTMDEGLSRAVREVFIRLYRKGLIYRDKYIINWCPSCHTALSDIEVEHEETSGKLHFVRYPLEGGAGYITVATTRPETILGDTAVAVHPADERYRHLVGQHAILPLVGRRLPIIADEYVDPQFGTGAVKVTPAHDPNDFEMGQRHGLASITVIGEDGNMRDSAGPYAGMDRYECRRRLLDDLQQGGNLVKIEDHTMALGQCQRCGTVVEPLISTQWFVRMKPLAEPAMEAVRAGRTRFIPERFTKIYLNWLQNIRDWCISRQIWWGHRIPAWYCQDCGEVNVAVEAPERCQRCGSSRLEQDPDALDTWFSSALWPFSTMGWPDKTEDLQYFFPTSALVTGYDIIFFWVARMIFMSLEFTGDVPFEDVLIHGLVRDSQGRKMSKSLGNGIDPLDVVRDYGADTLRFTLITGNTPGNDMRFYWERVEASRNFANKLWNASRFVMMNLEDFEPQEAEFDLAAGIASGRLKDLRLTTADRWILTRLNRAVGDAAGLLERYELGEAARVVYDFIWDEFCDWYIELVKPSLYGDQDPQGRRAAQVTLRYVLDQTLRLLHPFMPFITEAIWQVLPHQGESVMVAAWPTPKASLEFNDAEKNLNLAKEVIKAIRNLRAEMNVPAGKKADVVLQTNPDARGPVQSTAEHIRHLGLASSLAIEEIAASKPQQAVAAIVPGVEIYLPLRGLIDVERELARLGKERRAALAEVEKLRGKLSNTGYLSKAPAEVIEKDRAREAELSQKVASLDERVSALKRL